MLKKPEEYRQQLNFAALTSIVPLRYVILFSAEALVRFHVGCRDIQELITIHEY